MMMMMMMSDLSVVKEEFQMREREYGNASCAFKDETCFSNAEREVYGKSFCFSGKSIVRFLAANLLSCSSALRVENMWLVPRRRPWSRLVHRQYGNHVCLLSSLTAASTAAEPTLPLRQYFSIYRQDLSL